MQFPAELEKTMTGGGKKRFKKKKITGSNKFPHNGLKNKMLLKQVQQKVCVQKPYGQWECVGVLVGGAGCPLLPAPRSASPSSRLEEGRTRSWGGVSMHVHVHVCAHVYICACICACICVCMLHCRKQESRHAQECVGVL